MKNYTQLRKEAIKTAVELTDAMLLRTPEEIELTTFKLNNLIADMLQKLNETDENTDSEIEGVSKNLKK